MSIISFLKKGRNSSQDTVRSFYQDVFDSAKTGYIIYSKETTEIIEVNNYLKELLEIPDDKELKGLYISQIMMRYISGDSPNMETLMNDIGKDWRGEAIFITHQKKKFFAYVDTNILAGQPDSAVRIFSIVNNNVYREFQDEVQSANVKFQVANRSKDRFLSSMSHELRTPLNGIVGASNLVLSGEGLTEEIKNHVTVIRYSAEHMLGIINGILDFSKIDADKMIIDKRPFNLMNCIRNIYSVFDIQFRENELRFILDYKEEEFMDLEVLGDETKLSQILKNLLSNALKFTIAGSVTLIVRLEELSGDKAKVYFEIKDTGIGIPYDKQAVVFQAFEQVYNDELKRKYQGSGLGLTISTDMVHRMGGRLKLKSEMGEGSSFYFTIPFKVLTDSEKNKKESKPDPKEVKDIRGIRVLIVEDNEINAGILRSFLVRWGLPVKEAITGVHALELVKYHKFDLILMDIEMPEMDGYTTLKKIREQGIDIPIIAFTATLVDDMNSLITESGFTDYIAKPFQPADLKEKIGKYCVRKVDYI